MKFTGGQKEARRQIPERTGQILDFNNRFHSSDDNHQCEVRDQIEKQDQDLIETEKGVDGDIEGRAGDGKEG